MTRCALAMTAVASLPAFAQGPVFQMLPDNNATMSVVRAVSRDGRMIAGERVGPVSLPVVWNEGQLQQLALPAGWSWAAVNGISATGEVVSGAVYTTQGSQACIWRASGPELAPGIDSTGISPDGRVLLARVRRGFEPIACRVVLPTGSLAELPLAPGGSSSIAFGAGFDGDVIVGASDAFPVRWTGMTVGVLPFPSGESRARATSASYDGMTIAGFTDHGTTSLDRAVRWSGNVPRVIAEHAAALAISEDGARVVGEKGDDGFLWDPVLGERNLRNYLNSLGAGIPATSTWLYPAAISGDGSTIAGYLKVNGSHIHAFAARVPKYCYANCDGSGVAPILDAADFSCFLSRFLAGDEVYANCDNSSVPPVLNVLDFNCFLNRFGQGCP
jgi:uncharacterized membrane protein